MDRSASDKLDAISPSRFDHRFIRKLLNSSSSGEVEHVRKEYDLISKVFSRAGGSWERIVNGSPTDVGLIKKIVKLAVKKGYVTKKDSFA